MAYTEIKKFNLYKLYKNGKFDDYASVHEHHIFARMSEINSQWENSQANGGGTYVGKPRPELQMRITVITVK
jgi:hypothetical protein